MSPALQTRFPMCVFAAYLVHCVCVACVRLVVRVCLAFCVRVSVGVLSAFPVCVRGGVCVRVPVCVWCLRVCVCLFNVVVVLLSCLGMPPSMHARIWRLGLGLSFYSHSYKRVDRPICFRRTPHPLTWLH